MNAIERQFTDEQGQPYTLDLLAGQQDDGRVPTIRGDDDLVSVFYSLVGAAVNDTGLNRLSPIDGPQELVFSLGGEEVAVTLGENQQITFNNLEHIDRLDPADLLTMRLYVNQDAGNVLWEYAFTRNGLHVYYKIPGNTEETNGTPERNTEDRDDIEILSLLNSPGEFDDFQNPLPTPTLRTLGGLRLRYRYVPPSIEGATLEQVTWRIHHRGRYCTGYGVEPDHSCSAPVEAGAPFSRGIEYEPNESENVYWEPLDENDNVAWSLWAGENSDDEGVQAHLRAEYTLPTQGGDQGVLGRSYEQDFVIKTRELKPVRGEDAEPMQGSDVAMLEAMLWQFGVSPERNLPGYRGSRLSSEARTLYSAGSDSGDSTLEVMARRFQARNVAANRSVATFDNVLTRSNGLVGSDTLAQLQQPWQDYYSAYSQYAQRARIGAPSLYDEGLSDWLSATAAIWREGMPGHQQEIPASYTSERHAQVLASAGVDSADDEYTHESLLRAWLFNESPYHWGRTEAQPYRLVEGGYDEEGSLSFNQVLYRYRYSDSPCTLHQRLDLNYFDPAQNLPGFAVHTAGRATGVAQPCGSSFWYAFVSDRRGTARIQGDASLRGFRHGSEPVVELHTSSNRDQTCNRANPPAACEGDYERLAKAIGEYNGAGSILRGWYSRGDSDDPLPQGLSWAEILKHSTRPEKVSNSHVDAHCYSCGYSIKIRNEFLGLPYRTYIWHGGVYDEEMLLTDEQGNFQADENNEPILDPRAGQEWCFAYGEREWMDPGSHPITGAVLDWSGYRDIALTNDDLNFVCP